MQVAVSKVRKHPPVCERLASSHFRYSPYWTCAVRVDLTSLRYNLLREIVIDFDRDRRGYKNRALHLLGCLLLVLALLPGTKFRGRLGTKQQPRAIEPIWIARLVMAMFGIATIAEGIWNIRHH